MDGFYFLLAPPILRWSRQSRGGLRLDIFCPGNVTVRVANRLGGGRLYRGQLRRCGKRGSLRAEDCFREKSEADGASGDRPGTGASNPVTDNLRETKMHPLSISVRIQDAIAMLLVSSAPFRRAASAVVPKTKDTAVSVEDISRRLGVVSSKSTRNVSTSTRAGKNMLVSPHVLPDLFAIGGRQRQCRCHVCASEKGTGGGTNHYNLRQP